MAAEVRAMLPPGYDFIRLLGHGATSTVVLALQRALKRQVVVKLLSVADEELHARFLREARILSRVDSPGVSKLLDCGTSGDRAFIVSSYQPGRSLHDILQDEVRLSWRETARLGRDVAHALAAAHERGILHRDVKPANVVVTDAGAPVLIDFGLGRLHQDASLTGTGQFLGTPSFAAPEQFLGRTLDVRTDLYGLGVTMIVALTGENPFLGTTMEELIDRQLNMRLDRLPQAPADVPPALESLILQLVEKDPANRPDSAGEVAGALSAILEARTHEPPPARHPGLETMPTATATVALSRPALRRDSTAPRRLRVRLRHGASLGLLIALLLCAAIVTMRPDGSRASREPGGSQSASGSGQARAGTPASSPLEAPAERHVRVAAALKTTLARMAPIDDDHAIDSMLAATGGPAPGSDRGVLARRLEAHRWSRALRHLAPLTGDIEQTFPMFTESEQRTYLQILSVGVELTRADFLCRSSGLERPAVLGTIARLPGIRSVPAPDPDGVTSIDVLATIGLISDGALPASLWREASGTHKQVKLERHPLSRRVFLSAKSRVAGVWNTFARITIRPRAGDVSLRQVVLLFPDPDDSSRWTDRTVEILPVLLESRELDISFQHDRLPLGVPFGKIALENVQLHLARPPR